MRRRVPSTPDSAPPLEDDDILGEILLRLPPRPSSLPRASLVCRRWRRLASDPQFLRRFRARHRTPHLHGFYSGVAFVPTLDPPDRIPAARFSLDPWGDEEAASENWWCLTCCHGLVLCWGCGEFRVSDPMSGRRHRVPRPMDDKSKALVISAAAVPLANGSDRSLFRIVALFISGDVGRGGFASVYSSESGFWDHSVAVLPSDSDSSPEMIIPRPSTLVGSAIYWMLDRQGILQFDLDRQSLTVMELPLDADVGDSFMCQIMPAEGCQLGLAILAEHSIRFWERGPNHGSPARWVLHKTVHLDSFLPVGFRELYIVGFSEESKVIFLSTDDSVFMVQLETMQSRKVLGETEIHHYHIIPYSSF